MERTYKQLVEKWLELNAIEIPDMYKWNQIKIDRLNKEYIYINYSKFIENKIHTKFHMIPKKGSDAIGDLIIQYLILNSD